MPITGSISANSAILRISGCPIGFWLAAANPELFSLIRELDQAHERYGQLGVRAAEQIGTELVPQATLSLNDRRLALNLRRRFHGGLPISEMEGERLLSSVRNTLGSAHSLFRELEKGLAASKELVGLKTEVDKRIEEEPERVASVTWDIIQTSPIIKAMLQTRNLRLYRLMEKRVLRGGSWGGKKLRKSSQYVWQMIDRSATESTPRDWHGQVALLSLQPLATNFSSLAVNSQFALEWMENIHSQREELASQPLAETDLNPRLALTPLHWLQREQILFWTVDPSDPTRMLELRLRRTDLLNAFYDCLHRGAINYVELMERLSEQCDESPELLQHFTDHLLKIGVLQSSSTPIARVSPWLPLVPANIVDGEYGEGQSPETNVAAEGASAISLLPLGSYSQGNGYVDVYRQVAGALPLSIARNLQTLVEQSLRVLALVAREYSGPSETARYSVGRQARPLLSILQDSLEDEVSLELFAVRRTSWPPPKEKSSPYTCLLEWLDNAADHTTTTLDIDQRLLDELSAPEVTFDWPIDCLLRLPCPGSGYAAVLDEIFIAGTMDARFVTALRRLHGQVRHADEYRRFLKRIEQKSGVIFVELLIPPLAAGAANAVRRPIYTSAWTGDADLHTYCPSDGSMARYIPLDEITLRLHEGIAIAEVDGQPICPIYHATRTPIAPWDRLAQLLLSAAPLPMRWAQRPLHNIFEALPHRTYVPRITVGGDLILSCSQWLLTPDRLWKDNVDTLTKTRVLERLRRALDLPRWLFVSSEANGGGAVPCDLESIRALTTLEHALKKSEGGIILTEMLPTPDQFLVSDHVYGPGNKLASELLLRLPCDETGIALAERIAPVFSRTYSEAGQ